MTTCVLRQSKEKTCSLLLPWSYRFVVKHDKRLYNSAILTDNACLTSKFLAEKSLAVLGPPASQAHQVQKKFGQLYHESMASKESTKESKGIPKEAGKKAGHENHAV